MRSFLLVVILLGLPALGWVRPHTTPPAEVPVVGMALSPWAARLGVPGVQPPMSTCDFGQPDYGASCEQINGTTRGQLATPAYGTYGFHNSGNYGWLGGSDAGAYGEHSSGNYGWLGTSAYGAFGQHAGNFNLGYLGGERGAYGQQFSSGNYGYLGGDAGAYGEHNSSGNQGWLGTSAYGALGQHAGSHNLGYLGSETYGAYGQQFSSGNYGYLGSDDYGVRGEHNSSGNYGYLGGDDVGTVGVYYSNSNKGALGTNSYAVFGIGTPWAGYFSGNVHVMGTITEGAAASKIDHPLDPEGQYLSHAFVESPDMMNLYNGNAVLDAQGEATVTLPEYFEALNRDFRYQLTCLGGFAPVFIAEKISSNRFKIAGGVPGMEVSWQVTGIRHDAWANENRIVVEEAKPAEERGYYLHPGLYGQPQERSVEWARDPEGMRAMQEMPQRIEEEHRQIEQERQRMQAERERMEAERAQRPPSPDN